MRYMDIHQYNDVQRLLKYLTSQSYYMTDVEIEMVVYDNLEYILKKYRENPYVGNFYTLLSVSIKRKLYNKQRDLKRYYERVQAVDEPEVVAGSDYLVLSDEFYDKLEESVSELDLLDANVLYLYTMGETSRTTSSILGTSRHKVMRSLRNTKHKLHKELYSYGDFHHSRQYS